MGEVYNPTLNVNFVASLKDSSVGKYKDEIFNFLFDAVHNLLIKTQIPVFFLEHTILYYYITNLQV